MGNTDKEKHFQHKRKAFFKMEVTKQIEKDLDEAKAEALAELDFLQEEPRDRFLENEQ